MSADALRAAVRRLAFGESLTAEEAASAFDVVMDGGASAAQVAALLMALRVKGETAPEVAGAARALRRAMVHLDADRPDELVDTCGTGGGALQTFNISTAAALVAAGAGVRVAKHGNRSFTSQCGSADVLEALGVRIDVPVASMERALREAGIVFMFAPLMHPAMRHVGPIRRELGVPTVMNVVGPLANPASAGRQVVGVAERARVPLIAGALAELGAVHSLVVHGEPGLDEISPIGITHVVEIRHGAAREWSIDPSAHGFGAADASGLAGGDPEYNARVVLSLLANDADAPPVAKAAIVLNAAAAVYVSGLATTFEDGVARARASLESGAAMAALTKLRSAFGA